jgi:hypothetical protein
MRDFEEEYQDTPTAMSYELWLEMMLNDSRFAHKATLRAYAKLQRDYSRLLRHLEVMAELTDIAMKEVEQ